MPSSVRTLIVDDSAAMRALLHSALSSDPEIEVVGSAPEPNVARQMMKDLNPDVVTLDIEMPGMDGLSFLERIMRLRPTPVVMCSSLTTRGADVTIAALRLGAVDYVEKPRFSDGRMSRSIEELCTKVKAAARSKVRRSITIERVRSAGPANPGNRLIAIGASTGGVDALFSILAALPEKCPPVLIVQHMPPVFTKRLAERLNANCRLKVVEAQHGMPIVPGTVYIAPGGDRHMTLSSGSQRIINLTEAERMTGHRPSVDALFHSVVPLGSQAIGVILTGMGEDGASGLLSMRKAGARTFGQDANSCVVYGMPRAAAACGAVEKELGLSALPKAIIAACGRE